MGKNLAMGLLVFSMFLGLSLTHCTGAEDQMVKNVKEWLQRDLTKAKIVVTDLHCYFHAILKGKDANQGQVAQANMTATSPFLFGMTQIVDYPLTAGPSKSSKLLGRLQGMYASVSMEQFSFLMAMDIVFPDGAYNGSTLTVMGHNNFLESYREFPIVGGSGCFRLAQGVVILKPYFYDPLSGNATVEVNVLARHYLM